MKNSAFSNYRELSKSGIVTLVLISVLGGYLITQPLEAPLSWSRMLITLAGVLFLASGSSALNQLQEVEADAKMPRTANRPIPSGRISKQRAAVFVSAMLTAGFLILGWLSLELFFLGLGAVVSYNGLYTLWWKRHWAYAAIPGAIPGALPILMGATSASGQILTPQGIYLFLILFYWQMPHFWVLALKFKSDYEKGDFPTLPVSKGNGVTLHQISLWTLGYVGLAIGAPLFIRIDRIYLAAAIPLSLKIIWELRRFLREQKLAEGEPSKAWLHFFLWVNFSLIIFLAAAALDLWSHHLLKPFWV